MMLIPTISLALLLCLAEIPINVAADENNPQTVETSASQRSWLVTRDMWQARPHISARKYEEPVRLVIIQHTVSRACNSFIECATQLRGLQSFFLNTFNNDLPYNFIIGNDGQVYEGRGWNKIGTHTAPYNECSLGVGFVGDYRDNVPGATKVTPLQEARAQMLLLEGVRLGYLHPNFSLLGAKDLGVTLSPGENLQRAIQDWPNYDHQNPFRNLNCEQIRKLD